MTKAIHYRLTGGWKFIPARSGVFRRMRALQPEVLSSVIGDIYDCAMQPERWTQVLTRINAEVNGAYATIAISESQRGLARMVAHSPWDATMLKILNEEYRAEGVPGLLEVAMGEIDAPRSTLDQMSEVEFQKSKFYREWAHPQGLRDGCVMKFVHTADRVGMMAFITRDTRDIITADERRFLAALSPHVRRAAMIGDLLNYERVQTQQLRRALDHLATGVVLVDADARILYANERAEELFSAAVDVIRSTGRLAPGNPAMRAPLLDAIARASDPSRALGGRGIGIPVSATGHPPAVAYVLPLLDSDARSVFAPASAAVFIASSVAGAPPPQDVVATLYDLTPREANIMVQIGSGVTIESLSATLGLSENTIKSHLSKVFGKTGCARQSDLVQIISALSPPAKS